MRHFNDEFSPIKMDEIKNKRTNQSFLPPNDEDTILFYRHEI